VSGNAFSDYDLLDLSISELIELTHQPPDLRREFEIGQIALRPWGLVNVEFDFRNHCWGGVPDRIGVPHVKIQDLAEIDVLTKAHQRLA
jgi:hypothetical protein